MLDGAAQLLGPGRVLGPLGHVDAAVEEGQKELSLVGHLPGEVDVEDGAEVVAEGLAGDGIVSGPQRQRGTAQAELDQGDRRRLSC